jgi:8-oxo-dGTP diphosphatase
MRINDPGAGMQTLRRLLYKLAHRFRKIYWRIAKPKTFGVKVLISCGDQLLFVKHSYEGDSSWTLPGGGFKPQREKIEDAASREVREELNLSLDRLIVLGSYLSTAEYKRDTVYCLLGQTGSKAIRISPEIAKFEWLTKETIPVDLSTVAQRSIAFWHRKQTAN